MQRQRWDQDLIGSIRFDDWEETFRANTLGPMRVTEALLPQLARGERPLVLAISSHMGSIADIDTARDDAYRSSKAAPHAAIHGLAHELESRGIGALVLHPSWVRTRMGGSSAPISPEERVRGMLALAERHAPSRSGGFFRFEGARMPW